MDVTRTRTLAATSGAALPVAPDGPVYVLASGVRIRCDTINGMRVSAAQLQQAIQGVAQLPLQDQRIMAATGVIIELVPLITLNGDKQLGATNVDQNMFGRWIPRSMMVTVGSSALIPRTGIDAISETVQHEIGHVISVVTRQDRSEEAAIAYAANH